MDIEFIFTGEPVGGRISNYLLEKSRVVHQAKGERNFHIFYQLFNSGLLKGKPEDFQYLNQSGVTTVKTINDAKDFAEVQSALKVRREGKNYRVALTPFFKVIGFSQEESKNLLSIVAAVLNMGNIQFEKDKDGSAVSGPSKAALSAAAEFMGTTGEALAQALTFRTVATSRDTVRTQGLWRFF